MRLVVALGGNALLRRGEPAEAETQRRNVLEAASALAALAAEHELVLTHGNGPQVGLLALEADAYKAVAPYPLDVLGAESQGMIGYLLVQALARRAPGREVVALLTQVLVAADDPAFGRPTKPIGPGYSEQEARSSPRERGWTVARRRRGLPPRRALARAGAIVELEAIERLLAAGASSSAPAAAASRSSPAAAPAWCRGGDRQGPDARRSSPRSSERSGLSMLTDVRLRRARLGLTVRGADRIRDARRAAAH